MDKLSPGGGLCLVSYINRLVQHSSSGRVQDLFEDIKDGVLLCHLIEVLTNEALVGFAQFQYSIFLFTTIPVPIVALIDLRSRTVWHSLFMYIR